MLLSKLSNNPIIKIFYTPPAETVNKSKPFRQGKGGAFTQRCALPARVRARVSI